MGEVYSESSGFLPKIQFNERVGNIQEYFRFGKKDIEQLPDYLYYIVEEDVEEGEQEEILIKVEEVKMQVGSVALMQQNLLTYQEEMTKKHEAMTVKLQEVRDETTKMRDEILSAITANYKVT